MEWNPLGDKIIVRRAKPDENLSPSLVASEAYKKRKNRGVVVLVGKGRIVASGSIVPLTVKVGQEVLFNQHAGVDLDEEDKDLVVLREDELLAYRDAE